jgi:hypothetical protein
VFTLELARFCSKSTRSEDGNQWHVESSAVSSLFSSATEHCLTDDGHTVARRIFCKDLDFVRFGLDLVFIRFRFASGSIFQQRFVLFDQAACNFFMFRGNQHLARDR